MEVLHAKGQMYDQLQAQAESLEEQVSRMGGVETAARRLQAQLAEADGLAREREHTLELLLADKAYLGQQVELLGERAAAAEAQAAEGKEKVAELKVGRQGHGGGGIVTLDMFSYGTSAVFLHW